MQCSVVVFLLFVATFKDCNTYLARLKNHEKCVNIKKCEPVMRLLKIPMIKKKIFNEIRLAHCGFEGTEYKIYCDVQTIIRKPERFEPILAAYSTDQTTTTTSHLHFYPDSRSISKHPNYRLLDHEICGRVAKKYRYQLETRILGGKVTGINEFPWMALLAYQENDSDDDVRQFRCGATVINRNHVMTAAHCVNYLRDFKLVGVRIGEHDLGSERDCESSKECNAKYQDFGIDEVYCHSDFSIENLLNDIAIIRLNGSIDFSQTHVLPICLPLNEDQRILPKRGIVTGWGSTEADSPGSQVLLKVTLPILSHEQCENVYSKTQPYMRIWQKQFCAGGVRDMDSCTGDSGGPLQTLSEYRGSLRMTQRGIVSYGRRACGMKNSPGVYTNVAHYVRWILDTIRA